MAAHTHIKRCSSEFSLLLSSHHVMSRNGSVALWRQKPNEVGVI